jgi:hypothetical protein
MTPRDWQKIIDEFNRFEKSFKWIINAKPEKRKVTK